MSSGMLFREPDESGPGLLMRTLLRTLPVEVFLWAAGGMLILFLTSWYMETHCIFYRDVRRL